MRLASSVFDDGEVIPQRYSAPGTDEAPPLVISEVPANARSLVIIVEDLDSPLGCPVTHWLVWNIPPRTRHLAAGDLPRGAHVGLDTFGREGYLGPMAPAGRHRYRFRALALDRELDLPDGTTRVELDHALQGRVLDQAELTGIVERGNDSDGN